MRWLLIPLVVIVFSVLLFRSQRPISDLCDLNKCPFCYGENLCEAFAEGDIILSSHKWMDIFYNYISIKNVYIASYLNIKVVLKKLAHNDELKNFDHMIKKKLSDGNFENNLFKYYPPINFKACDNETEELFLNSVKRNYTTTQLWTITQVNVEPLILQVFSNEDGWSVPKFFGACGRLIVEQYCGDSLNLFETAYWDVRVYLANQLLKAAFDFTTKHPNFRLYLTDISPDNIAVDEDLNVFFVDLENVILTQKLENQSILHRSEHFEDEKEFMYSEDQICESSVSDHNIYAICYLFLSKNAPWPMMKNGLLHSPPRFQTHIVAKVEQCVNPKTSRTRFEIALQLIGSFDKIIEKSVHLNKIL